MSDKIKLTKKVGKFSGNRYLKELDEDGTRLLEEYDYDTPEVFQMWVEDIANDPDFKEEIVERVQQWKDRNLEGADPTLYMTGQSHIDMAWKWRYRQTRRKGIKTLAKAVKHAKLFPNSFIYAASEPSLLEWIKEDKPDLYNEIKEYHKKGNIVMVGGAYVEPDCMMPSGEAFVRQRLYGMKFYKDEFGVLPQVEWFLDSFGYNVGLPQILAKSGAKYLWTNKMTWNDTTIWPFVNFHWESPSGDRILTAAFTQNLSKSESKWNENFGGRFLLKEGAKREWNYEDDYDEYYKEHIDKTKMVPAVGLFLGKGDGGHGPTHQQAIEMNEYITAGKKVNYDITWADPQEFFERVAIYKDKLPIWKDEMYLEYHRGCFSVHSETKRHNRKLENLLPSVEKLCSITGLVNSKFQYPFKRILNVWKDMLMNQFHDVLPGSSVPEVYDDTYTTWVQMSESLNDIIEDCYKFIPAKKGGIRVFNPLTWQRKGRVFIPFSAVSNSERMQLDENGKPPYIKLKIGERAHHLCQPVAAEYNDDMENNPAGWWTILTTHSLGIVDAEVLVVDNDGTNLTINGGGKPVLSNGISTVKLSPRTGAILEITSKGINQGNNVVSGKDNFLIKGYNDFPKQYPAWNIMKEYWDHPKNYPQDKDVTLEVLDEGPIFITMRISKTLTGKNERTEEEFSSTSIRTIRLFKEDPTVYCSWESKWNEPETLLKVEMNTTTNANSVTVDEQYCSLKMSTKPETPADKARYEKFMHKYADLSTPDNEWGMTLLNEGKYAFDAEGQNINLTLHRSPKYPAPAAEAWINEERKINKEQFGNSVPIYSGLTPSSARFAYYFHPAGSLKTNLGNPSNLVKRAAEEFNNPVIVKAIQSTGDEVSDLNNMEINLPPNVELSVLKRKEWEQSSSLIMRLSEISGIETTNTKVKFPKFLTDKIKSIKKVDLLERPIKEKISWNVETKELRFTINKFEIISLELELE